jgi:transmembrane sensor
MALALSWWILTGRQQTYSTEIGGLSRVVLKDGSTVTLNTDSELRVRFSRATRLVELLKGEAQFSVAHDRKHPFEVLANGSLVLAVGTAFDVKLDHGQSVDVLVTEGRVAVLEAPGASGPAAATAGLPETVSAGESAVATQNGMTVRQVSPAEVSRDLAWQVGELSFQGETLSQAVAEFNRYNRRKLRINDPSILNLQIGGNFEALDIDSFVAALERSFGITVTQTDHGNVILSGPTGDSPPPAHH